VTPETLQALLAAQAAARAVVLATRLPDGTQYLLPHSEAPAALAEAARHALAEDRSRIVQIDGATWFLQVQAPPHRLLIVGAVHIAQTLAPMAAMAGFAVTVIDPRRGFATAERFPGVTLLHDWPDEAMDALLPDTRTAVVTLSHDPKLDDPALDRALRGDALFVGSLGSRKTHAARLERLAALGHGPEALARVRGPVGLPLGAVSAPEIALSVLAELVAVRRGAAIAVRGKGSVLF
jgi:xanthine dehydrogenase accessory factor